jgi:hypothetical protein
VKNKQVVLAMTEYAKNLLNGHLMTTGAAERSHTKEGINEATSMTKP